MVGLGTRKEAVVRPINAGGVPTMILQRLSINIAAVEALTQTGSDAGTWSDSAGISGIATFARV